MDETTTDANVKMLIGEYSTQLRKSEDSIGHPNRRTFYLGAAAILADLICRHYQGLIDIHVAPTSDENWEQAIHWAKAAARTRMAALSPDGTYEEYVDD
jgi:hypothetical protein